MQEAGNRLAEFVHKEKKHLDLAYDYLQINNSKSEVIKKESEEDEIELDDIEK